MKNTISAHIALFLVNAFYAANHLIAKGVMPQYLKPNIFILLRVLGASLLFWLVKVLTNHEKIERKDLPLFILSALTGVTINQLFFFNGLSLSSPVNSGIIMTLNPIMVLIITLFFLKEKITFMKGMGVFISAIGAILLSWKGATGNSDSMLGDLYLFLNAASYAVYLVIVKPLMQKYSPLTVITYVFTFGLIIVMLYPPVWIEFQEVNWHSFTAEIWYKTAYIIVFVTFFTYLLTMYGLKYLSAYVSSAYIYVQPILVLLFTFLFSYIGLSSDYTSSISIEKIGYMLMILIGVYLSVFKKVG